MGRPPVSQMHVTRASLALLGRLRGPMLAALLAVTIGTNLIDFATAPAAGQRPDMAFALAALLRVALVFWISFVVQRRIVDPRGGFRIGPDFWRFSLLQILLLIGMIAVRAATLKVTPPAPALAGEWLANFIGLAAWGLIAIRLLAWNAALAAGAPLGDLGHLWRNLRGHDVSLLGAFAILVLPFAALHVAFTLISVRVEIPRGPLAFLGIVDGLVSALQLALSCAVAAVALRLATGGEAR
ncbi:hypothetical protein Q4F19_05230 [Sphingomonas sp. BIUV-7]|uniref:Uncharacterized protein n=1 Tax=Sphingomonas natans TaxID=3063330 RepID=A0ABT8Y626_9SPHN|nr:hypothetical protein [Sphingomonas sp. BIUV-7]MDO6413777.1 hypothetical protein [Sphingomonas sp. BIUV-7]